MLRLSECGRPQRAWVRRQARRNINRMGHDHDVQSRPHCGRGSKAQSVGPQRRAAHGDCQTTVMRTRRSGRGMMALHPTFNSNGPPGPMRKSHQFHAHALTATRAPSHVPDVGANECGVRASYTAPAALADQITSSPFIVTCHPAIFRQSMRTSTTAFHIVMATSIDDGCAAVRLHHGYKMDRADQLAGPGN